MFVLLINISSTSYLRHLHLVVHSEQQRFETRNSIVLFFSKIKNDVLRLRFPVYVIQQEELPPPVPQYLEPFNETKIEIFRNYVHKVTIY